jgi:hypothetical protein
MGRWGRMFLLLHKWGGERGSADFGGHHCGHVLVPGEVLYSLLVGFRCFLHLLKDHLQGSHLSRKHCFSFSFFQLITIASWNFTLPLSFIFFFHLVMSKSVMPFSFRGPFSRGIYFQKYSSRLGRTLFCI